MICDSVEHNRLRIIHDLISERKRVRESERYIHDQLKQKWLILPGYFKFHQFTINISC